MDEPFSSAATLEDLPSVWPAASASHVFEEFADLEAAWSAAPWSVRVTPAGEAAVLRPWRRESDLLAILGLWCAPRRIPDWVREVEGIAHEHGFGGVLGPTIPETASGGYVRAGMKVAFRLVCLRLESVRPPGQGSTIPPAGVLVREAAAGDVMRVASADRRSFDDFWAEDPDLLADHLARGHAVLAERNGQVIGYTLATVRSGEGTIGRLAVVPEERRRGVGRVLLAETLGWLASREAVRVTLCTQEDNVASRRLYAKAGFREMPDRLVGTVSRGT